MSRYVAYSNRVGHLLLHTYKTCIVACFSWLHLLGMFFFKPKSIKSLKGSAETTHFLQLAQRTRSAMLTMKRTTMERNAACGCSVTAQPTSSVLIGAMIVVPTERQIKCWMHYYMYTNTGKKQWRRINFHSELDSTFNKELQSSSK